MLLTIPQVAERLGVSRWRVYARINNGEIGYVKSPSGRKRITEEELQRYIARHTVPAASASNEVA